MRQSILLKLFIIIVEVALAGGAVFLGFRHTSEVRGETVLQHAVPEADTLIEEDPAAEYLRRLSQRDLATYVHPGGAFSFRYPKDFELLTSREGDEQVVNVLHPDLPLEIWIAVYPEGRYALDLPDDYESYTWPAPAGAEGEAVVFLEQGDELNGGYRGVIWFDAGARTFEIRMHAPEPALLVEWMDQVISEDLTIPASASSPF